MRFVQKWSYASARHLASVMDENHKKRQAYYYGFYIMYGALVKVTILVSIAYMLGVLVSTLLVALVFCSLRLFAGGYHMDTYGKCLLTSIALFIGAGAISQYTHTYWSPIAIAVMIAGTSILGFYAIVKYAPKDTPNKPITAPEEIRKFKRLSLGYLIIWLIAAIVLMTLKLGMPVLAFCFGLLFEAFTLTPTGHYVFNFIRSGLSKKKEYKVVGSTTQ